VDAVGGRVPLVVGIDGATQVAVARARRAVAAGASGLMVLPPGTARSTTQLVAHYRAIADAAGLPVLVQDSPQVTGVTLTIEALESLHHADPLLGSLKVEVPGAGAKVSAAIAVGIEVIAGWGGLNYLESMRRGAVGCMPGCDLGAAILDIDRRWRAGDPEGASDAYRRIVPLLSYVGQSLDLLVLGSKRMLRRKGIFTNERMRQPSRVLDPEEAATIDALLDRLALESAPGF
jgi:4-hydroxy-tetrahydrodipicolinate synthase